MLKQLPVH